MKYEFIATRHNGKEGVTLHLLYAQAAREEPIDFDIYGFRIRYVPERTCKMKDNWDNVVCSACGEIMFGMKVTNCCPNCGAKVIGSSKYEQGASSAKVVE